MISTKDWIPQTAWRDMYLTPTRWIWGTVRDEKGRFEREIDPPDDCLMIARRLDKVPTNPLEKEVHWSEIKWRSKDVQGIELAQGKWGVLPQDFPPLSLENAAKHGDLRGIKDMKKSEKIRPLGSRVRLSRW